jgi:cysteine synthase
LGAIVAVAGVTAIETRGTTVTVRVVVPTMFPEVAVMLVDPAATAVAKPAVLIVATD